MFSRPFGWRLQFETQMTRPKFLYIASFIARFAWLLWELLNLLHSSWSTIRVIENLESQTLQVQFQNPTDIRVLLNYIAKEEVAYTPDEDEIIAEHLRSDQVNEQEDDTEELLVSCHLRHSMSPRRLNTLGCRSQT